MKVKSLRDEFAMAALTGLLSSSLQENLATVAVKSGKSTEWVYKTNASTAYNLADAMLKEREGHAV